MDKAEQSSKYKSLCTVSFFGIFTCCLFTIFVRWLYMKGKINQVEWDVATITANDYTVEMKIRRSKY